MGVINRHICNMIRAARVVDQDRDAARHDIVRVELLDGEVPAVGGAWGDVEGQDSGVGVLVGVEGVARLELAGGGPLVGGAVPEGVVGGRVKGVRLAVGAIDRDVDEVGVVVDPCGQDGPGADVFIGLGVAGLDLVADADVGYRLRVAVAQQDGRVGAEAAALPVAGLAASSGPALLRRGLRCPRGCPRARIARFGDRLVLVGVAFPVVGGRGGPVAHCVRGRRLCARGPLAGGRSDQARQVGRRDGRLRGALLPRLVPAHHPGPARRGLLAVHATAALRDDAEAGPGPEHIAETCKSPDCCR